MEKTLLHSGLQILKGNVPERSQIPAGCALLGDPRPGAGRRSDRLRSPPGRRADPARLQHAAAGVRRARERGDARSLRLGGGGGLRVAPVRGRLHPRRGAGLRGAAAERGGVGPHRAHAPRAAGGGAGGGGGAAAPQDFRGERDRGGVITVRGN